jgi:polyvinyl alcohol dehydrogenase (cytochrome)
MKVCVGSVCFARRGRRLPTLLGGVALMLFAVAASADPIISGVSPPQVSPGSMMLISGSGFGNAQGQSYVMLGQHQLPAIAWTDAAIRAYVSAADMVMAPGQAPTLMVIQQPGSHMSNGFMLTVAGAGPTTPPTGTGNQTQAGVQAGLSQAVDLNNAHASTQSTINSANVAQFHLAWTIPTQASITHMPLVDGGRVLFADWAGNAYAADATTGKILWQQHLEEPNLKWPWWGFAGVGAVGQGTLFEASAEGDAFALDEATGTVKWHAHFAAHPAGGNIGQILYNGGLVYIGLSSVEEALSSQPGYVPSFTGAVMALDANTGKTVWERPLVQPPANGVSVWSSFALDPAMNALFFATGNNYTGDPSPSSDAMYAVNAKTGDILWFKQILNNDIWVPGHPIGPDWDFSGGAQLFTATVNGQTRQLVGAGSKSGIYWAFDRNTGDIIWATGISNGGVLGGMHAEASVGPNMILAWGNDSFGINQTAGTASPADHPMTIKALDPGTGKPLWVIPNAQPASLRSPGFLSNDVYLVGSLDGKVRGYRISDGQQMWTSLLHGSIGSGINVAGDSMFFGTGVLKLFGGNEQGNGVVGYTTNPAVTGGTTGGATAGTTTGGTTGGATTGTTGTTTGGTTGYAGGATTGGATTGGTGAGTTTGGTAGGTTGGGGYRRRH